MAWEDWNDSETAASWNEILDVLEDEARRFATSREEELKFFVTAGRWDEPDVEVRWTDGDLQRNVHLMANGKAWPLEVEYSAGVWLDFDESSGRKRIWDSKVGPGLTLFLTGVFFLVVGKVLESQVPERLANVVEQNADKVTDVPPSVTNLAGDLLISLGTQLTAGFTGPSVTLIVIGLRAVSR